MPSGQIPVVRARAARVSAHERRIAVLAGQETGTGHGPRTPAADARPLGHDRTARMIVHGRPDAGTRASGSTARGPRGAASALD
ncbi:hypothetical protein J2S47_001307 [Streptomyces griseoviridis]|uniref:Uncharacterized protein n=1 Tax=Streptomyces griseoviridis TaxID=45398 RepID=A0ABT9LAS8_STRGD|nr:hypothetical protein [Streptomyces griseoviridis]